MAIVLESVFKTLSTNCQLTSWDIQGEGKTTTLVLRWDSGSEAAIDQQLVSFVRYRKKSPSELRRDSQRAILEHQPARQQTQPVQQTCEQGRSDKRPDTAGTQTTNIAVFSLCLKVQLVILSHLMTQTLAVIAIKQKQSYKLSVAQRISQQGSE